MKLTENHVAGQILDYLKVHGYRVHRLEADMYGPKHATKREEVGTPDYIAMRWYAPTLEGNAGYSYGFYLELKRPGGSLRKAQEIWIADARKRGIPVAVCDSLEALQEYMEREGE